METWVVAAILLAAVMLGVYRWRRSRRVRLVLNPKWLDAQYDPYDPALNQFRKWDND